MQHDVISAFVTEARNFWARHLRKAVAHESLGKRHVGDGHHRWPAQYRGTCGIWETVWEFVWAKKQWNSIEIHNFSTTAATITTLTTTSIEKRIYILLKNLAIL